MNKKYLVFGLGAFMMLALVSAAVVTYWGQTEIDMSVENSFVVDELLCSLNVIAGDGAYELCEFSATNNLERPLSVDFELSVQELVNGQYVNLADDAGVYVAFSEDLRYVYNTTHNPTAMAWEDWMMANPDWFDWDVMTQAYPGYYNTTVINGVGRTGYTPLTGGVLAINDQTIPGNYDIYGVVYLGSGLNLVAGDYRVLFKAVDVSEVATA